MLFKSTRGQSEAVNFEECILKGMAPDGGLYYPVSLPLLTVELVKKWKALRGSSQAYQIIACDTIELFAGDTISRSALESIIAEASRDFRLTNWTHFEDFMENGSTLRVLELFHGPTYSFKDYALMILSRLIGYFLQQRKQHGTVLVATSGDTGSAALVGLSTQKHIRCAVLLPQGRVSAVQQRMMTTIKSSQAKCILVNGTFDDCQRLLKEAFADLQFVENHGLMAVNSVNFGRIICQMVYYFWITICENDEERIWDVSVPTGNFGNILAAWYARKIGARLGALHIASSQNDILPRFYRSGTYKITNVVPTITPAIDIALSSNFERLLKYYLQSDTRALYDKLSFDGYFEVTHQTLSSFRQDFSADSVSEEEILHMMREVYRQHQYIIDPHTAVAYHVAQCYARDANGIIVISTAHPAKFPDAVIKALGANVLEIPADIQELERKEEHYTVISTDLESLKDALHQSFGKKL